MSKTCSRDFNFNNFPFIKNLPKDTSREQTFYYKLIVFAFKYLSLHVIQNFLQPRFDE